MIEQEITLAEILLAREQRVAIQNELLSRHHAPVISFTMNIAGPVKVTGPSHRAFLWGCEQLRLGCAQNRLTVLEEQARCLPTGEEAYFAVDAPAEAVKALCVDIEEGSKGMGRLFDMDVIGLDGLKLERGVERHCIVCGKPGRDCASRRLHSVSELQSATAGRFAQGLKDLDGIRTASLATRALLEEVAVTPKPGLVDRANSGSHRDMDFSSFQASASALWPYWQSCFLWGWQDAHIHGLGQECLRSPVQTFAALRPLGRQAERNMLAATGGVNTHKGAIFTLGVLCGAIGRLWTEDKGFAEVQAILDEASAMTRETLEKELPAARWNTAGEGLYREYGARGIRGEVADGLPSVRDVGIPTFRALLAQGVDRNHAAAVTLLHLIARVEDTNLLHRGGPKGAAWAKETAADLLEREPLPSLESISALDAEFIRRNLSPGGCADLLAATLFIDSIDNTTQKET